MSQPSAPPPYDDKNPLYPPPPGGYPQPPHYPGGYPASGGYPTTDLGMAPPSNQLTGTIGKSVTPSSVYAIISLQLLVTVGIISVFTFVHPVRSFVQRNVAIYYAS
uniref:Uncharacterized protein n=1 Tax=Corvus moneduloides TaxID=1196302 RepID=A0A8U7MW14_CORMO